MLSKILKLSLQIIASLVSISCTQLPRLIPNDFQLMIMSTPIQPRATGNYSLMIRRISNKDQYELIRNYDNTIRKLTLSTNGVQRLYDEVRAAKVFRLKNSYEDMNVLDGSNTTLTIHAAGKTKIINMRNSKPVALKRVSAILREFELEIR
jgi:hypothetical protein